MSKLHREAFAHILYGISSDGCLILLTGDVGTGKTTVSRCLIEQLPEKTDIAIILNPKLTVPELLRTICEELHIPVPKNSLSGKTYIDNLNSYLLDAHARGRSTALLIDEAQNLGIKALEQLRLLTNLETNTHKLLQIVLLGQPELRDMLSRPQLTQFNQRITSRYHLQPLQSDDVEKYIHHRINIAGGSNISLFSPRAIKFIIKTSKGIPRIINILCDRGLLGAYAENRLQVSLKIIKKAANEVSTETKQPFFSIRRLTTALLLLLLGVCFTAGFYFFNRDVHLSLLPQAEVQQPTTLKSPEHKEPNQPPQKRIIIINPVSYDTDLTDKIKSPEDPPGATTGLTGKDSPLNGANNDRPDSEKVKTAEIE
ncbi:MAG: AAA family ATPase [Desulfobulbaceae bacterium]|nr:AAA family ATPase [Desulfobulbaceae bacterium]